MGVGFEIRVGIKNRRPQHNSVGISLLRRPLSLHPNVNMVDDDDISRYHVYALADEAGIIVDYA